MRKTKKRSLPRPSSLALREYGLKERRLRARLLHHLRFERPRYWWKERRLLQKILLLITAAVVLWTSGMYAIARWYIARHDEQPLNWGATFIADYARSFDLNPQATMQALIDDMGLRRFRLVSYWDHIESEPGVYNFSELDWQFAKAEASNSKVSLAVGLRQPRWPECHMPAWALFEPKDQWYPQLTRFMTAVVDRYKHSPALDSYQLENEYFLRVFGECPDFSRQRLVEEFNLVKKLDPAHPVMVSRSNNAVGLPVGQPRPDFFGVSVYKRVWDKTITKRYIEYPFPAWFYGFLAGAGELLTGKDMIIHEMQAEPWPPTSINQASLAEQDKSLNASRLEDRLEYARATGMRTIDLWGAEWWYWRKVRFNDPTIWDTVKREIQADQFPNRYSAE